MDWKTWIKQYIEHYTGMRIYRYSLPRGVDFAYDVRDIIDPKKVSVVFDVGANVGQSAEKFRIIYPNARILCFEPVSATFHKLHKRVKDLKNAEAYQLGFGDFLDEKSINIFSFSPVNSFINSFGALAQEKVRIDTLDQFCLEKGITEIDLLKVDVEGYEIQVLNGASKMLSERRIRCLYLEATAYPNDDSPHLVPINKISDLLRGYGYSIFGIYDQEMDQFRNINCLCYFNVAYVQHDLCKNARNG